MVLADYGLYEAMGDRAPDPDLLTACLDLFCGHPVPAMWMYGAWRPAPRTSRRLAYASHLVGAANVGSYPFSGVPVGSCGCPAGAHTCDGLGASYFCLDLDDHSRVGGMEGMVSRTIRACRDASMSPLVFTSQSGTGAHVYVFLDRRLPTSKIHAAARAITDSVCVTPRSDVLPSSGHPSGYGTLHAIPLNPAARPKGGGILLTQDLKRETRVVDKLVQAHYERSRAVDLIAYLEASDRVRGEKDVYPQTEGEVRNLTYRPRGGVDKSSDTLILRAMRKHHPQFKVAVATTSGWAGKRSTRDAVLASQMLRQGMTPSGVVEALVSDLPGTKSSTRGVPYARALVARQVSAPVSDEDDLGYAGCSRPYVRGATPWVDRTPPPLAYGADRNPWWEPDVQARLLKSRSPVDRMVLAYLVDRWFTGPTNRRMYYLGHRRLGAALSIPPSTASASVRRITKRFRDVLRILPGVPHYRLRIATAYDVVGVASNNSVGWYPSHASAGQSDKELICSPRDEISDSRIRPDHTSVARGHAGAGSGHDTRGRSGTSPSRSDTSPGELRGESIGSGSVLDGSRWVAPHSESVHANTSWEVVIGQDVHQ